MARSYEGIVRIFMRVLVSIMMHLIYEIQELDIKIAFLKDHLDVSIYMI